MENCSLENFVRISFFVITACQKISELQYRDRLQNQNLIKLKQFEPLSIKK